jgi:ABC-type antimicrobial peptide transport system permease subunit
LQYLVARTTGDPTALASTLRSIVKNAGTGGAIDQVLTMETRLMTSLARPRLYAVLLGGFATFALLIAAIGLFGGLSYSVAQRTREIGVRTALGATPRQIVMMVLRQGGLMVLVGLTIGLGSAIWATRFLSGFLFDVPPSDITTLVVVGAGLAIVALVACAIPARRAAKIDALTALRT